MQAFLAQQSARFGFSFGIQETAEVAARLTAGEEPTVLAQLTGAEAVLAVGLRSRKRQAEWLAGRMATKAAFGRLPGGRGSQTPGEPGKSDLLRPEPSAAGRQIKNSNQVNQADLRPLTLEPVSVLRRPSGAPYLAEHPALHVSISHACAYAVAVVAGFAIGVDIEKIEPRPEALLHRFFCLEERRLIQQAGQQPALQDTLITQFWSRKEAVAKYLRLGGHLDFQQINTVPDRVTVPSGEICLVSGVCDGYCVSLALPINI